MNAAPVPESSPGKSKSAPSFLAESFVPRKSPLAFSRNEFSSHSVNGPFLQRFRKLDSSLTGSQMNDNEEGPIYLEKLGPGSGGGKSSGAPTPPQGMHVKSEAQDPQRL